MFTTMIEGLNETLQKVHQDLDRLSDHIRFKCIRSCCVAGSKEFQATLREVASKHRSKNDPPLRRDRSTGEYIVRPHFADSIKTKVWRIPDGSGYFAYIGPIAVEEPHAHLLEEGTAQRRHKSGHPTGRGPALHLLRIAYEKGKSAATSAASSDLRQKLAEFSASS